jgi:hypothetical protein
MGFVAMGLASSPYAAAEGPAAVELASCVARLDREIDVGYRNIAARCPELAPALAADGLGRWLPPTWREPDNDLSAGGLEELGVLTGRELVQQPLRPAPRTEVLARVLRALESSSPEHGLWARLRGWLRAIDSARAAPARQPPWLPLAHRLGLGDALLGVASYASAAAVILLALLMLASELRGWGVGGRLRRWLGRAAQPAADSPAEPSAARTGDAPMGERPRLLLELIVERLRRRTPMGGTRALTTRELVRQLPLADPHDVRRLAMLALVVERLRYSLAAPSGEEIAAALSGGEQLYERLGQPPGTAP